MGWQQKYGDKIISAEKAAKLVKSGDLVRLPVGKAPIPIMKALTKRNGELRDVTIIQCFPGQASPLWTDPEYQKSFNMVTDYVSDPNRPGMKSKLIDFLPIDYPQYGAQNVPGRTNTWQPDVFFGAVSPPDDKGYCSFGNCLWYSKDLAQNAKLFVAEIDPTLIRTYGDNFIHVSEIDYLVEETEALVVSTPPPADEDQPMIHIIGEMAATLIRDGDTMQMGVGPLSESLGLFLEHKNDLGIHSEIMTVAHIELVKKGIANGKCKSMHKGKAVSAFVVGAADLKFVDNNPAFELYSVLYTNRITTIAAQHSQVAVNSCLAIDFTGQVSAESFGGPMMYSGIGGQMDFMMGSMHSEGGRSIMLLQSTARKGKLSRIVPQLEPGAVVTTPRTYIDNVITEHGIANLQGKTQRQRAEALIEIAHPDFRSELRKEARKLFWP
ncbi:MAG TPA: acetyl-CoA hydrolase/transferase C-terminal domain-containing protein [Methyloceanibacter sp.]|nr:acetyl-CoA hydrolase/transferase C-terminal domain-containing protein [Methyloceanibacter sp.]